MKILYLSSIAFDANLSLIKRLGDKCDLTYLFELRTDKPNRLGVNRKIKDDIIKGTLLSELIPFSKYIPLEKTYAINSCRFSNFFQLIIKQIKLFNFVRKLSPDIIHCGNELPPIFFLTLLLSPTKKIVTVHDPIQHTGEDTYTKRIIRFISFFRSKAYILLNKTQVKPFKTKYNLQDSNIYVSSLSIYEFLQDYSTPIPEQKKDQFNILFFGRISPYKGIEYLLEAFIDLQNKGYTNMKLTIAGGGKYYFEVEKYRNNIQINIINEFIPNNELVMYINEASIIVCPYTDATQSGVVMSAFALNKPVLATNVGGLAEMIEDGVTGIIIPPKNTSILSKTLEDLYHSPHRLLEMQKAINLKYRSGEKSWSKIANDYIQIYNKVLQG